LKALVKSDEAKKMHKDVELCRT